MGSNRSPLLIGAGVVALVVITVIVVLFADDRETVEFGEDTPEGALQRYLAAFDEGDLEKAHAYFSNDVRDQMSLEEYERTVDAFGHGYGSERVRRALFDGRSGDGDSVRVELTVEELSGEGLGASTHRYPVEIRMVREDDAWRIDEPLVWLEPAPIDPRH